MRHGFRIRITCPTTHLPKQQWVHQIGFESTAKDIRSSTSGLHCTCFEQVPTRFYYDAGSVSLYLTAPTLRYAAFAIKRVTLSAIASFLVVFAKAPRVITSGIPIIQSLNFLALFLDSSNPNMSSNSNLLPDFLTT
jgi:hypothetical protein